MISSQPSGGDEPPRRSESRSSGPRDGPPRTHTLPYDRPDKAERYDRPRPARRDSRAGPEVRERDWRRPSRPSTQHAHSAGAAQPFNRRDDRSARDRLLRERRRFDRPRERLERPERPEGHERSDMLDRRSSWQHTSAPYVREHAHHEHNGNGSVGSTRVYGDEEHAGTSSGRSEPRFTRRPGNSFWDLMKGQTRSDRPRPPPIEKTGHDDRRAKFTERPRVDGSRDNTERRDRSQSVSPQGTPYHYGTRQGSRDPMDPHQSGAAANGLWRRDSMTPGQEERGVGTKETTADSAGSPGAQERKLDREPKRLHEARAHVLSDNVNKVTSSTSSEHLASNGVPSVVEDASSDDKSTIGNNGEVSKPPVELSGAITAEKVETGQHAHPNANGRSEHASCNTDTQPATLKFEESTTKNLQPSESTTDASMTQIQNDTTFDEHSEQLETDVSATESMINADKPDLLDSVNPKDGVAASQLVNTPITEDEPMVNNMNAGVQAAHSGDADSGPNSAGTKDAATELASRKIEDSEAKISEVESTQIENTDVDAGAVSTDVASAGALSVEPEDTATKDAEELSAQGSISRIVETDARDVDTKNHEDRGSYSGSAISLRNDVDTAMATDGSDVEMPDAVEPLETERPNARKGMEMKSIDYFLQAEVVPNTFSTDQIVEKPPKALPDPPGPPVVETPQELQLQNYLTSTYDMLSSEVPPGTFSTKKWSLSAPDPRVSLTAMIQHAKVESDIRARQAEFSERKREWLRFCEQLDNEATSRSKVTAPVVSSKGDSVSSNHARRRSKDFEPEVHRRSRERSRAHGDVARSEAEFLEILANLEAETARDPLVRARQTSARIPPQRQEPVAYRFMSTDALIEDHSELTKRLKTDAVDDFTAEEHELFVEAYVKHPKEFGQIAKVVGRGFNECVMHYYRTKKQADYKRILQKRRKSKRGRKPKKKELDGETPVTPTLEGTFQFESPGTPKTTALQNESAVSSTPLEVSSLPVSSTPVEAFCFPASSAPEQEAASDHVAQALGGALGAPLGQPAEGPVTTDTAAQDFHADKVQPGGVQPIVSTESQQAFKQAALDSRIPPPVFPLSEQSTVPITNVKSGSSTLNDNWPPSTIAQIEYLFGLHGSKLDEIALQMNLPAEMVRDFYERNHDKYLSVIQKVDSFNARSKASPGSVGPNAGFFPPRNKNVPTAKTYRAKQRQYGSVVAADFQPVQPIQQQLELEHQQQEQHGQQQWGEQQQQQPTHVPVETYYHGIPPVVQPPHMQHQNFPQQPVQPPVQEFASRESQPPTQRRGAEPESAGQHPPIPEEARPTQREQSPPQTLSLSALPILPCMPNPRKLAEPVEIYPLDYPFLQYRESNERRRKPFV